MWSDNLVPTDHAEVWIADGNGNVSGRCLVVEEAGGNASDPQSGVSAAEPRFILVWDSRPPGSPRPALSSPGARSPLAEASRPTYVILRILRNIEADPV